jgi:hydrogenase maturation factor
VWREKIPILPETLAFSRALHFDPLALIASGALLVVASPASVPHLLLDYARQGIPASVIGEIRPRHEGILVIDKGRKTKLQIPKRDEIARLLG